MNEERVEPDRFWNRVARWYDRRTHEDERYSEAVERFAEHLDAQDTVLDYACASGVIAFKIAPDVKEVHGIDTSARMIELARKRAGGVPNVRFAQKSIFDRTLERESYDVIVAYNILHLVEDAGQALKRARELLKPGALLISSTPCRGDGWGGTLLRILGPLIRTVTGLSHLRFSTCSEVNDLIGHAGLEIVESEVRGRAIQLVFVIARRR